MRQRVSMARTLASEPKILLMDEPFAALDEQTRLLLGDKVLQIQQDLKQTTLLITHNLTEAVQLSDRILVMTYRPGKTKRMVEIKLPRPAQLGDRRQRRVRPLRRADLERPARGGEQGPQGRRGAARRNAPDERSARSRRRRFARQQARADRVRRRLPARGDRAARGADPRRHRSTASSCRLPLDIVGSFRRIIAEEHVCERFLLTCGEALARA